MIITLTQDISVPSEYLDKNLRTRLLDLVKSKKMGTCSKKYGMIKTIISLDEILGCKISLADGSNIATVTYTASTVNPTIGDIHHGIVQAMFNQGVFVKTDEFMVLITFPPKCGKFSCCEVKVGDPLKLKITESEFRDGMFSCVGEHFH